MIDSAHIRNITASKITAGTINAHEIILKQQGAQTTITAPANMAILRSSNYNGSYNNSTSTWSSGTAGWVIGGDGYAEFGAAAIRGGLKASSVWIDTNNRWNRNAADTANVSEFKAGSATKYLYFDGTNLTFTGNLSAAGGTFSGDLSAAGGTFTGTLQGVDGTFTGSISAGQITAGTITATISISSLGSISGGSISGTTITTGGFTVDAPGSIQARNITVNSQDEGLTYRCRNAFPTGTGTTLVAATNIARC